MKKKIPTVLIKRVILHPGEIRSKYDGQRHFIGHHDLMHLYGVLPTDIVVAYNHRNQIPLDRKYEEGWIDLYPSNEGEYHNIHELDQYQAMPHKSGNEEIKLVK